MAQVIPSSRSFTNGWRHAGYIGEIPEPARIVNVRDYGALGDGSNNDAPAISAAMAALGAAGGVIYFPAGTYTVPQNTVFLSSNIVLRGERSFNTTILSTNLLATQTAIVSVFGGGPSAPWINIQSGYDLLSWAVTLTNVSSFAAGDWVEIHEGTNSTWKMSNWPDMIGQIMQVASVNTTVYPAGTLTFTTPLRLQYEAGLPLNGVPIDPQIRKFGGLKMNAGIENLRFSHVITGDINAIGDATRRNNVPSIYFRYAVNCWVRGCEFTNIFGSACSGDYSANIDITGNYIHHAFEFDGGGSGYGMSFQYRCGEILVENNIFKRLRHSMLVQAGANGNVFGYNYSEDQYKNDGIPTTLVADLVCHGNYAYGNLFEGNCAAYGDIDSSHGANGPYNTYFRNRTRLTGLFSGLEINDTICSNQTFVGNEDPGNYKTNNRGMFAYGNNHNGTIKPAGTDSLPDYSYYLGSNVLSPSIPAWWNIDQAMPLYGPTNVAPIPPIGTERDIPARVRFTNSTIAVKPYGPPSLFRQPTNQVVNQGQTADFLVGATGTPVAVFQWYKDGNPVPTGTNAMLSISPVDLPDAGLYWAVITDSCGRVTSAAATLTVQKVYFPIVATGAVNGAISPSGTVQVGYGTTSNFLITAQAYYHITNILTNSANVPGVGGLTNYDLAWGPTYAGGTISVTFAENLTVSNTPEWWLARHGLTSPDFATAAREDSDGDGFLNWMEYVANTVPTNRNSALRITTSLGRPGGGGLDQELRWRSSSNRTYGVWWTTNIAAAFEPLVTNLAADPPTNAYVHSNVALPVVYYRIHVK